LIQGFVKDGYYIFYVVDDQMVNVIHVVKGDRDLEKIFHSEKA